MKKLLTPVIYLIFLLAISGVSSATLYINSNRVLESNLNENIQIVSSNITLDCNFHILDGKESLENGIFAHDVEYIIIKNCLLKNFNGHGISISQSSNSKIESNTVIGDKGGTGCGIIWQGNNNEIINNRIQGYSTGICNWWQSENNIITGNTISNNGGGILVHEAANNHIYNNRIISNDQGILIRTLNLAYLSKDNIINENLIHDNKVGILISSGIGNLIYHNNILNNTNPAQDSNPENNNWNHPTLAEGNYWDKSIDYDYHPFIKPNEWFIKAEVDYLPKNIGFRSSKWITVFIGLPEGYSVKDIDASSLRLSITSDFTSPNYKFVTGENEIINDKDDDGVAELVINFDRAGLQEPLTAYNVVDLTISGKLKDGTSIQGNDVIRINRLYKIYYNIVNRIKQLFER
jgi:parallel beta-helix repeat protein